MVVITKSLVALPRPPDLKKKILEAILESSLELF
jgi:hypothetical protein